ncbi:uncharacterized protein LOC131217578 [Magnolia sinica]|uniref:uncharacterized protein LOC131217578 n=1 Tax=Magnolia sinica TaxID=86752 RepID=UPI00265940CB|nr:uncharacterized protein LOC131217578 [Magnolia sinica]
MADPPTANSNLTTSLYHTDLGLAVLTWSRTFIYHNLTIDLHINHNNNHNETNIASFSLHLNPWLFWKKQGSKTFHLNNNNKTPSTTTIEFHWDFTRAKFLSGPEPHTGFFIAVTFNGEMLLLIGDSDNTAYSRTKSRKPAKNSSLLMRREHVFGNKAYSTRAMIGGKICDILIECGGGGGPRHEPRLSISIDGKRVLQVKRLKWKFRGNEKLEYDGVPVQVWWDVYNWVFEDAVDGHAVFMFRFEKEFGGEEDCDRKGSGSWQAIGMGLNGLEKEKMKMKRKKSLLKTMSSSSSSSSASSGCSSSVMEWASMEESEMQSSGGFSLMVYAWRS